jgi:hypothetical protein
MIYDIPLSQNFGIGSPLGCSTEILWHKLQTTCSFANSANSGIYDIRYTIYAIRYMIIRHMTYNIRYTLYVLSGRGIYRILYGIRYTIYSIRQYTSIAYTTPCSQERPKGGKKFFLLVRKLRQFFAGQRTGVLMLVHLSSPECTS